MFRVTSLYNRRCWPISFMASLGANLVLDNRMGECCWLGTIWDLSFVICANDIRLRLSRPMLSYLVNWLSELFQLYTLSSRLRDGNSFWFTSASLSSLLSSMRSSILFFHESIVEHSSGQLVGSSWYRSQSLLAHHPILAQQLLYSGTSSTRLAVGARTAFYLSWSLTRHRAWRHCMASWSTSFQMFIF